MVITVRLVQVYRRLAQQQVGLQILISESSHDYIKKKPLCTNDYENAACKQKSQCVVILNVSHALTTSNFHTFTGLSSERIVVNSAKQEFVHKMALYQKGLLSSSELFSSGSGSCEFLLKFS